MKHLTSLWTEFKFSSPAELKNDKTSNTQQEKQNEA